MENHENIFQNGEDPSMININIKDPNQADAYSKSNVNDSATQNLNNSQEHPKLVETDPEDLTTGNANKRVFSSAGSKRVKSLRHPKRVHTAKVADTRKHPVKSRVAGQPRGNQGPVRANKKGRKKHKRIPLNHYEWPEDSVGDQNYKRPTTANHGQGRKKNNYDRQRLEMQSRGKPIAMGLTGTSQENAEDGEEMMKINTEDPNQVDTYSKSNVHNSATQNLNNSQEHLKLVETDPEDLITDNANKRVFSSVGSKRVKSLRHPKRVHIAKVADTRKHPVKSRVAGQPRGNQGPVRANKKGRKKHKRIPLNHYEWPEDSVGDQNYKRPTTANHGQGRKKNNYDRQRLEMQSRGKPIAMGLTGTSQENAEDGYYPPEQFSQTEANIK